ncbi:MAG: hypothetical protein DDT37_01268 [Firmicutes bacterium]|nr:hypothetical protein [candidate division NPL-UPA2 bacterium]
MGKYTITRDGQKDLRFTGEKLADADNKWVAGQEQNRWQAVALYKTASGEYVLMENYYTLWQGETDRCGATVCETAQEVLDALTTEEGVLSDLDKELLQNAAKVDVAFDGLWLEELE